MLSCRIIFNKIVINDLNLQWLNNIIIFIEIIKANLAIFEK